MSDNTIKCLNLWNAILQYKLNPYTYPNPNYMLHDENIYQKQMNAFQDLRQNLIVIHENLIHSYRKRYPGIRCIIVNPRDTTLFPKVFLNEDRNEYKTAAWISRWLKIAELRKEYASRRVLFFMETYFNLENQKDAINYIYRNLIFKSPLSPKPQSGIIDEQYSKKQDDAKQEYLNYLHQQKEINGLFIGQKNPVQKSISNVGVH